MTKSTTTSKTTSKTTAQQAALDALRAKKSAAVEAPAVQPEPTVAESAPAEEMSQADRIASAAHEAIMKLVGFGSSQDGPTWKRRLTAFFAASMLAIGAGYAIGALAGYAIVGIAALGGSALWAFLIMILAMMLSVYTSFKIGEIVGNYVLSGKIDKDIAAVKNKVTGFFGSFKSKPLTVAQ